MINNHNKQIYLLNENNKLLKIIKDLVVNDNKLLNKITKKDNLLNNNNDLLKIKQNNYLYNEIINNKK